MDTKAENLIGFIQDNFPKWRSFTKEELKIHRAAISQFYIENKKA